MKHCKSVEFLSNFRMSDPHTNVKPPCWRLSGDGTRWNVPQCTSFFLSINVSIGTLLSITYHVSHDSWFLAKTLVGRCRNLLSPLCNIDHLFAHNRAHLRITMTVVTFSFAQRGETALHMATRNGKQEVVDFLLLRGAEPDARKQVPRSGYAWLSVSCNIASLVTHHWGTQNSAFEAAKPVASNFWYALLNCPFWQIAISPPKQNFRYVVICHVL